MGMRNRVYVDLYFFEHQCFDTWGPCWRTMHSWIPISDIFWGVRNQGMQYQSIEIFTELFLWQFVATRVELKQRHTFLPFVPLGVLWCNYQKQGRLDGSNTRWLHKFENAPSLKNSFIESITLWDKYGYVESVLREKGTLVIYILDIIDTWSEHKHFTNSYQCSWLFSQRVCTSKW